MLIKQPEMKQMKKWFQYTIGNWLKFYWLPHKIAMKWNAWKNRWNLDFEWSSFVFFLGNLFLGIVNFLGQVCLHKCIWMNEMEEGCLWPMYQCTLSYIPLCCTVSFPFKIACMLRSMAIWVLEFSNGGYYIRKIFA